MSQREGHAMGAGAPPTRPADAPSSASVPVPARDWDDLFPALPPHRQQQLLDTAHRQGFLFADQVPPREPNADSVHLLLQQAFSDHLSPAPLAMPVVPCDDALDEAQRDAVARAIQTPDLLLICGPSGTGKTRVAIEIARQVVDRGGRVLMLSPDSSGLDVRLPELAASSGVALVRRVGPGESAERLPTQIAALTRAGQEKSVRESLLRRSAELVVAAEERMRRLDRAVPAMDEFAALTRLKSERSESRKALISRRDGLESAVGQEVDTAADPVQYFIQRVRRLATAHARRAVGFDGSAAELAATRAEAEERRRAAEVVIQELRPRADALAARRWYSPAYWRARFDSTLITRLADAEGRMAAATTALDEVAVREQKLAAERRQAEDEHSQERQKLIDAEVARRRADLDTQIEETDRALAADATRAAEVHAVIRVAGIDPASGPALLAAERDAARRELEFAHDWKAQVDSRTDELVREACRTVNIVAGPVAGIANDADAAAAPTFDLLIVDDAHKLVESDFVSAARCARRSILLGESVDGQKARRSAAPDLFARMAAAFRHEVWGHEGSRLVCRLCAVRGVDRRRLECEPVADAPDIELRLFTPPCSDPTLAEVAFPDRFSPAAAREYLVRELGEVTCQPRARTAIWETNSTGPVVRFGPLDTTAVLADAGAGIREELIGLETRAVHFSADWSIDRAKSWAAEHIGQRESGRLVSLTHSYRACPGLARWLNRAFASGYIIPAGDDGPHVEFLAVPDTAPRRRENGRARLGGAGYEIDLADPRQRAALPTDLADLPAGGFVNVSEAQALVRYLELVAGSGVTVTSPFPTQVAVLRRLLSRSGRLAAVSVLDPIDVARSECDVLVVSLTRSHVARAVTFGENPAVLAGLIGRARKRLLFVGDPGTLSRRLQWEGPVDHLDAIDAARERAWVAALADCPRVSPPRRGPGPNESARA